MVQADFDGDGRKDLAVAYQDPNVAVAWYRSESVDGTQWSSPYEIMAAINGSPGAVASTMTHSVLEDRSKVTTPRILQC